MRVLGGYRRPPGMRKEAIMEQATYRVNVTSPGLTVMFRNRVSRTPVLFKEVYENELDILELQLKQKSMAYTVDKNILLMEEDGSFDETPIENDEIAVEELYVREEEKSESILDKLIAEDK